MFLFQRCSPCSKIIFLITYVRVRGLICEAAPLPLPPHPLHAIKLPFLKKLEFILSIRQICSSSFLQKRKTPLSWIWCWAARVRAALNNPITPPAVAWLNTGSRDHPPEAESSGSCGVQRVGLVRDREMTCANHLSVPYKASRINIQNSREYACETSAAIV